MADSALDTFKGGTARISYAAIVGSSAASFLETEMSPAAKAANKDFTAARAGISDFVSLRESLAKRKGISERLGQQTLGFGSSPEIVVGHEDMIANAVKAATAKYGMPEKPAASTDAPAPQFVPVPAKGPREIN